MTNSKPVVLFVDDDEFMLDMYSMKLSKEDFEVVAFQRAQDALEALKQGLEPDLILVDIIMPEMDGIEFLQKISELGLKGNAKIVMLTNQSESTDVQQAREYGAQEYIVKANTIPSEVVVILKKLLSNG